MIRDLPPHERPRERCLNTGPQSLSLRELFAILIGRGIRGADCLELAEKILQIVDPTGSDDRAFFRFMERSQTTDLGSITGLGPAARSRMLATFDIARRYFAFRAQEICKVQSPTRPHRQQIEIAALRKVSANMRSESYEWLGFVPMYQNGQLGDFCLIERGVRTHVNVEPAELFGRILSLRPFGFFLLHNHPSGVLTPSAADLDLTRRVGQTAIALGLAFLGHWVVSPAGEMRLPL